MFAKVAKHAKNRNLLTVHAGDFDHLFIFLISGLDFESESKWSLAGYTDSARPAGRGADDDSFGFEVFTAVYIQSASVVTLDDYL